MSTKSSSNVAISGIGQIAINVRDLDRAVEFYRDRLQLPFLFRAPPGMAFFQCGSVRLLLGAAETAEPAHPASIIYYRVEDIEAAHAALRARNVETVAEPHLVHKTESQELWLAFLKDTEGNTLALMSERAT